MFRVSLKDFTVYGKHGAYEAEHSYQQPFIVSITVELNDNHFGDNLSKTVNYAFYFFHTTSNVSLWTLLILLALF